MMKPLSLLSLLLILAFALAGCSAPLATASNIPTSMPTPVIRDIESSTPTAIIRLPTNTASPTMTVILFSSLEPIQIRGTMQPLLKAPMNCAVPCFWGILPGKTHLDEARIFFSRLGFTSREGDDFYSTGYEPDDGGGFSAIFYTSGTIIENIEVTPYITKQKEGSPREWIAYSPETLIKRYGKPSNVQFAVGLENMSNISITMIMYFDTPDLIVLYSGYHMTPKLFCPLTVPFDNVRLWMGHNPPDTPSFDTVSLEKATSLTMDQFTQLIIGDSKKACFAVNVDSFQ